MAATTAQTPRRSKRHQPVVFTNGNSPSLQAHHHKWASPSLHTRRTTSVDLVDDEESTVDATTTFYSDFLRSSRPTGRSRRATSEMYSIGDTVLLATSLQKPSIGVIIALWEVSRHVAHSQMFANIHWFLRPAELARTRTKREHLEVRLFIPTLYILREFINDNLY
jgi:origin recognition complex subunit 1